MIILSFAISVVLTRKITKNFHWRFFICEVNFHSIKTFWKIIRITAAILIHSHLSIQLVIMAGNWTTIYRNLLIISCQTMALRIRILQQFTLQHFIIWVSTSVNHLRHCKCNVLNILKIIGWILI